MLIFKNWELKDDGEILARQYDHLSRVLLVSGVPEGWDWQLLIGVGENFDIIDLSPMEGSVGVVLTEQQLPFAGYYKLQLLGTLQSDGVTKRHTDILRVYVGKSLSGDANWPEVPSEFTQAEYRIKAAAAQAGSYAVAAAESAAQAKQYADSVDADQLNARISAKGDNLEFDEAEGLLYLTSGGERIGDGIKVLTSGGSGGGGESNNAVLTLTNTTGWIYRSIAYGASCPLSVSWSSLEDGLATGKGVLKVTVGGTLKHTAQVEQGALTIDVGPWLPVGSSTVKVNVTDVYGNSRSLNFNLTTVQLTLESSFDASTACSGAITFPYTPTGTAEKTVHFLLDGTELDTVVVTASGRQQTMTIPAQPHGDHPFEVWFTAVVDGETVESNHLYYDLICVEEGNTTPIIATSFQRSTAEQYDSIAVPYIVYDPAGLTAAVTLKAGAETVAELTVDRTEQVWTYRADSAGALTLSITCGSAIKLISLTVTESTMDVAAETDSLALHLTSYGRSNNEEDPGVWQSGGVTASFSGFNWTSDGWKNDDDGITALRVAGDARVTIPLNLFARDFRTTGKTIEVEFATRDVLDYDAVVLSCWSGDRGLKITAQKALLKSEQSELSTQYKEDEHVRLSFVVQKRSEYRLLLVYINGILSGAVQYCSALTTVDFPSVTSIGSSAFNSCSKLTTVNFPSVTSIGNSAFSSCSALTTVVFPEATSIGSSAFNSCPKLTTAEFPAATSIGDGAFRSGSKLTALILRSETMATLAGTNAFTSTPIQSGTGYIYVPAALVDSYKAATNWSTYANKFRAIEDYPEITGGETV